MRRDKIALYVHLVWGTWDRFPLITPAIERRLYRSIEAEAVGMGCTVLALNGVPDHVHLLVRLPSTLTVANLVKQVKGVSSHLVNENLAPGSGFRWQGYYGAFTISRWDVDRIKVYIRHQKEHHKANDLVPELEEMSEEAAADRDLPEEQLEPSASP